MARWRKSTLIYSRGLVVLFITALDLSNTVVVCKSYLHILLLLLALLLSASLFNSSERRQKDKNIHATFFTLPVNYYYYYELKMLT